ncbi:MAG: adenylate cyclase regulatory domain-containing protein [Solirubrobacteraceae bacterium]
MDFGELGLLDGLEGEQRAQRERLLTRLADDGFSEQELTAAVKEDRLALLPVERVLGGQYTAEEIEERSGVPADLVIRVRGMLGLPDSGPTDRVFAEEDIDTAKAIKLFMDAGFGEEPIGEISRVLGEGMARLAATITAAFTDTFLTAGDGEDEVALRFAELAEQMAPATKPILVSGFQAHLRDSVARGMLGRAELQSGDAAGAQEMAVCFADLVGFTRLGGQVDVRELGTVVGRLSTLAAAHARPPVRLIKTIGDAALLVSREPEPLVEMALELVAAFEAEDELPSLRAGIALGPALFRAGDYYGNSVNLASRVTGVARPGSVLCTREVRDATREAFHWSAAGRHRLKGVSGPTPLYRARSEDGEPQQQ